jgi:hypothetical protein
VAAGRRLEGEGDIDYTARRGQRSSGHGLAALLLAHDACWAAGLRK